MSTIEGDPGRPAAEEVAGTATTKELATILVKHFGLHEGKFNLAVEYQVGSGPIGPNKESLVPGIMVAFSRLNLVKADKDGPLVVDASEVNPRPRSKSRKS
ncbi:hypothetical protein GCM10027066_02630 [Dyella jejuensis]